MGLRASDATITKARRLRRDLTLPECLLWEQLRGGKLEGLRFRRQHAIGPYVLDFHCASVPLAVEVDGSHHDLEEQMRHDNRRDDWLRAKNIEVLRIAAGDILDDHLFEGALRVIALTAMTGKMPEGYVSPGWADDTTPPSPRFAWSPSPVNGGRTTAEAGRALDSSPAKRGRGTAEGGGGGVQPVAAENHPLNEMPKDHP